MKSKTKCKMYDSIKYIDCNWILHSSFMAKVPCAHHTATSIFVGSLADSINRWHLTSIGNLIVEIRRSYDRLISTMGFSIRLRWHHYIESESQRGQMEAILTKAVALLHWMKMQNKFCELVCFHSTKIENNICTRVTKCFSACERVVFVFISQVAKQGVK